MDKKRIRTEMAGLIKALGAHAGRLEDGESPLTDRELEDIAVSISVLYDKSVVLKYLESLKDDLQGQISNAPPVKQESEPELIRRAEVRRTADMLPPVSLEEMTEVMGDINQEQVRMPGDEHAAKTIEKNESEVKKTEQAPDPVASKVQQPDLFAGELPPVVKAEPKEKKPAVKDDKSVGEKLQKKPIPDLKAAIGINEKFQFINQLFHGNMTEYNIAINQINICGSKEEAEAYLETLRELYKWNVDSEAVVTFTALVERRFL